MKSFRLLFALAAAGALLAGCVDPPGPSPIYSRLPAAQGHAPQLSKQEQEKYNQIDRQVLADQQQAMTTQAAAQAYESYYHAAPVAVYGGYYGGGGGNRWGPGVGVSVGTGYWW